MTRLKRTTKRSLDVSGGVLSNSLAIATDAAHLLTDFASFMISLFSIWVANRPATKKMPFGWYRAEVGVESTFASSKSITITVYRFSLSLLLNTHTHTRTHRNTPMMQHSSLFTGNRSFDVGPVNMGGHWNSLLPSSRENNSQKFRIKQYSHVDHLCCWRCGKSSVSDALYSIERLNRSHPTTCVITF